MRRAAVLALALLATNAAAQEEELHAAPGSIGIGILENADALDFFDNLSGDQVVLRHTASGLVCWFGRAGDGEVKLLDGRARGDNVLCHTFENGAEVYSFATRMRHRTSLTHEISTASDDFTRGVSHLRRFPSTQAELGPNPNPLPDSRTRAFTYVDADGAPMLARVSAACVGAPPDLWRITMIYAAPAPDAATRLQQESMAARVWTGILNDIVNPQH